MGVERAAVGGVGVDEAVGRADRHGGVALECHAPECLFRGELVGDQLLEPLFKRSAQLVGCPPRTFRATVSLGRLRAILALASGTFAGQRAAVATDLLCGSAHGKTLLQTGVELVSLGQ